MFGRLVCVILLVGCMAAIGTMVVGGTPMPISPSHPTDVFALGPQPEPPDLPFWSWLVELFRSVLHR